jgi:hypothetical protein
MMRTEEEVRERYAVMKAADPRDRSVEVDARIHAGCLTLRWVLGEDC